MTTILATPAGRPRPILGDAVATVPTDLGSRGRRRRVRRAARRRRRPGADGHAATVAASGLRGRGGAGYPAGTKWRAVAGAADPVRYVVGNGYEADPAQATNRVLMEARPFAVVEGIAIAALAVGAREAIIAVRAEYADAVAALEAAVFAAEEAGFLGTDILRSGRDVAVTVRTVQGAYMLGEETVLIAALEGRRGQPEQRPPYPTERGLWGHPTLVHNVATLATVPWIVTHGADAFRAIGDPDAPGTVLVGVSGAVANPGIVEVPTGTTLRELVDLAGGVAAGHTFKAALVGGPTGGLLPEELLDTPYSFDALRGDRRPRRVGRRRDRRRAGLRRGPGPAARPLRRRRGLRQDDPLPDRPAPPGRDRPALRRRHGPPRRPEAPRRPRRRLRGERAVRPRAPGIVAAPDRDAILRSRDRRPHPPGHLPRRRLQPDRGCQPPPPEGRRRPHDGRPDLAPRRHRPADQPRAGRRQPRRAPLPDPGAPAAAVDAGDPAGGRRARRRGPRGPDDPGGLPRQRDRDPDPLLRAQAAGLRRLPDVRGGGGRRGASRRSRARARPRPGWWSGPRPRRSGGFAGRTWS